MFVYVSFSVSKTTNYSTALVSEIFLIYQVIYNFWYCFINSSIDLETIDLYLLWAYHCGQHFCCRDYLI